MSTRLDHTWLPASSRNPGDGTKENGPIDYGNGAYGYTYRRRTHGDIPLSPSSQGHEVGGSISSSLLRELRDVSVNIFHVIDGYTKWSECASKGIIQTYTDEKIRITNDDVLWFLRYEDINSIAGLLNESRYTNGVIQTHLRHGQKSIDPGVLPHALVRAVKKAIDELFNLQKK